MTQQFKIVDDFYGASGGKRCHLGMCDEVRDTRRFSSREEAEQAINNEALLADDPPEGKQAEDRFGRRWSNLVVVPEQFRWCYNVNDDRWSWQEPTPYDFGVLNPGRSLGSLSHTVTLDGEVLGTVRRDHRGRWQAECKGALVEGDLCSAYYAAEVLRHHAGCLLRREQP